MEVVKSGWLQRRSSVLRKWKRNWFVLYLTGELRYYETRPGSSDAEIGVVNMAGECLRIKTGRECDPDITPPAADGQTAGPASRASLLTLILHSHGKALHLCAESEDDMRAWQLALEQARSAQLQGEPPPPPPYAQATAFTSDGRAVPVYVPGGQPWTSMYYSPEGRTAVVVPGDVQVHYVDGYGPYGRRGYHGGYGGMGTGLLAGAALGSLLFWPWGLMGGGFCW